MSAKPTLFLAAATPQLQYTAAGTWTAAHANDLEALIDAAGARQAGQPASIDMHKVEAFDTYGAWLLERFIRTRRTSGAETTLVALPDRFRDLVKAMHKADLEPPPAPPPHPPFPTTPSAAFLLAHPAAAPRTPRGCASTYDHLARLARRTPRHTPCI